MRQYLAVLRHQHTLFVVHVYVVAEISLTIYIYLLSEFELVNKSFTFRSVSISVINIQ